MNDFRVLALCRFDYFVHRFLRSLRYADCVLVALQLFCRIALISSSDININTPFAAAAASENIIMLSNKAIVDHLNSLANYGVVRAAKGRSGKRFQHKLLVWHRTCSKILTTILTS